MQGMTSSLNKIHINGVVADKIIADIAKETPLAHIKKYFCDLLTKNGFEISVDKQIDVDVELLQTSLPLIVKKLAVALEIDGLTQCEFSMGGSKLRIEEALGPKGSRNIVMHDVDHPGHSTTIANINFIQLFHVLVRESQELGPMPGEISSSDDSVIPDADLPTSPPQFKKTTDLLLFGNDKTAHYAKTEVATIAQLRLDLHALQNHYQAYSKRYQSLVEDNSVLSDYLSDTSSVSALYEQFERELAATMMPYPDAGFQEADDRIQDNMQDIDWSLLPKVIYDDSGLTYYNPKGTGAPFAKDRLHITIADSDVVPYKNLNGKTTFPGADKQRFCRHFSCDFIYQTLTHGSVNVTRRYADIAAIQRNIPIDNEAGYEQLKAQSSDIAIIDNHHFGRHLENWFAEMRINGDQLKVMLIGSGNHAMAVSMHIRGTAPDLRYQVDFYEPNKTNKIVSIEVRDPALLGRQTLKQYVDGIHNQPGGYEVMYPLSSGDVSIVYDCHLTPRSKTGMEGNRLSMMEKTASGGILFDLCMDNALDILESIKADVIGKVKRGRLSQAELVLLLDADHPTRSSPLYIAMEKGYPEAVRIIAELLSLVSNPHKRSQLIQTSHLDGRSALFMAAVRGQHEAIAEYKKVLILIDDTATLDKLIVGKCRAGTVLEAAMQSQSTDTILACTRLRKLQAQS